MAFSFLICLLWKGEKVCEVNFSPLKKNREFQSVYRSGLSKVNRCFVMIIRENGLPYNRIGISVSKKVGNSIIRHRVTRVIREIMRLHWEDVRQGYDIVIVARKAAKDSVYRRFESAIIHLLNSIIYWKRFQMKTILIKCIEFYQKLSVCS